MEGGIRVIKELESIAKQLSAIADLLETETIESKHAAEAIRKALENLL